MSQQVTRMPEAKRGFVFLVAIFLYVCGLPWVAAIEVEPVDFASDVAPIFQQHCVRCHSDGLAKGDVSLSTIDDLLRNGFVDAGDPDGSYLIELVTPSEDGRAEMPIEGEPLSDSQVNTLRTWIRTGANWPDGWVVREKPKADASWWAYQPLRTGDGEPQSVDDFIRRKLSEKGLTMNAPADRRTLIRRATYDLIGLPPTPEEVQAFIDDPAPNAYEKVIDRLLASPHYGERWGRHWLDVVRFGESNGFERNVIINDLWPFRDYVIESLNRDVRFDQFIREHIAGDVIDPNNPDAVVGTAFLVAGPYDDVGNQDAAQAAQIRANTLDEIINATGEAFLGMTLGCARCHDHKFDPISQEDYYALYATFSGIRHGRATLAGPEKVRQRADEVAPLQAKQTELVDALKVIEREILERAKGKLERYQQRWPRSTVDRTGTEETFSPVVAKFVRLVCEANDINLNQKNFRIDEFEVWSKPSGGESTNVALASNGGKAVGRARSIKDFPNAYGPQHAIDGRSGERFISAGDRLTIELAEPTEVDRVVFSSARGEEQPGHQKFSFVAEYRIEVSRDGETWTTVASGADRKPHDQVRPGHRARPDAPAAMSHLNHRLMELERHDTDRERKADVQRELAEVRRKLSKIPPLRQAWIGTRNANDAKGPFHVFLGGSPQKPGKQVVPASPSLVKVGGYQLESDAPEAERRRAFANWVVDPGNPLTPRVLANRIWHYHFGTGIVDTPSDFGFMGGRPTHPGLLDYLANQLKANDWRIKPLHRMIMLSAAYRQSSNHSMDAARLDGDARLLWRFPPRRLSSEEIRDTLLFASGQLNVSPGGPGFRLYEFLQDNVCTYVPLDRHGAETHRRSVYHQNARASVVDLMTDFDQPDCAFSAPKRSETTTPLQALTMLNHQFTIDMAASLAKRLRKEAGDSDQLRVLRAYRLCYSREPSAEELRDCVSMVREHGLEALCRVLLNTSELIFVQ